MRRLLSLLPLAALAVALWPASASAGSTVTPVELVGGLHREPVSAAPKRFTLAGVHWRGPGRVVFRTRSLAGHWSAWRPAAPEDEDGPDSGSSELRAKAGWRIGNPWWAGPSDRIEARTFGHVSRVRAYLVWSPELRVPFRAPAATASSAATQQPALVPRQSWGANESIRRAPPSYAPAVRFAIVHHTAGRNTYSSSEAAAIVRGIQLYHVQSNGWNDIGYNFLVDRFGTIYEGRYGGIGENVVGAHAQGFNTGSVGIALLGTYGSSTPPSKAAEDAIARLIAWRLDLGHVDPTGLLTFVSGGSDRFLAGVPVPLRAVSGHRDTGATQCPGDALYTRLGALATSARRLGLPKIFDPRVEGNDAGFRFTARLSSSAPWSVVVTTAGGEVARGAGTGMAVDWTWDATAALAGTYTWTISSGTARPAGGTVRAGATVTLALQEVAAVPAGISPNGDGQADSAVLTYRLTAGANVTVEVLDPAGSPVATVVDRVWTRAGENNAVVDGALLVDGRYDVVITARRADGAEATTSVPLVVSRTLGTVAVSPTVFSPNGDGRKDRVTVTFSLASAADVRVRVLREGRGVAGLLSAQLTVGSKRVTWTGLRASGSIQDGEYSVVVDADDAVGRVTYAVPLVSDTTAPRVRILPGPRLRVEVSEPAVLRVRIGASRLRREVARAGVVRIPWSGPLGRARVVAVDAAGNTSPPAFRPAAPGRARPGQ
ncbi:MAG TPA: peptidoglycan recognition protein [Gaiellaceae bacterium]|nr:peptidoglycan recognition protein [Gaiellaceae bacterium]